MESVPSIATRRNSAPIAQKKLADEENDNSVRRVDSYYIRARLLYPLYDGQLFKFCMVYLGWLTSSAASGQIMDLLQHQLRK